MAMVDGSSLAVDGMWLMENPFSIAISHQPSAMTNVR
jgi:hypothetical protein